MVKFFKPQKKEVSAKHFSLTIIDIDIKGRGVAKSEGVTWFVEGALPNEEVIVRAVNQNKTIGTAELISVKRRNEERLSPICKYASKCGGCSLLSMPMHIETKAKSEGIKRLFKKVLQFDLPEPEQIFVGEEYQYRRVCRLSVTGDKKEIHLGLREANGKKVVEIEECKILESRLSELLKPLRKAIESLSNYKLIGHIEMIMADSGVVAMFRTINVLPDNDKQVLINWAKEHNVQVYLLVRHEKQKEDLVQKEELVCIYPEDSADPYYEVDGIKISFKPNDFIQVNSKVNKAMIDKALSYLDIQQEDQILDLFCGLGNFTLPIAKRCKHVYGIEGVWTMVNAAKQNSINNNLPNAEFYVYDLEEEFERTNWAKSSFNKVCLDPGRQGAQRVMPFLVKNNVKDVVYVSCNPLTLVRDIDHLLKAGYSIKKWSMFEMFPKTEHVETVVLLSRN